MQFERPELVPFRCEVEPDRAAVRVRPIGELDLTTAPVVEAQLAECGPSASGTSCSICVR